MGKFYPVGNDKFGTAAPVVVDPFHIDFGAQTTGTANLRNYPAGTVILNWAARVTEAAESLGSGTMQIGFPGTPMVTTAMASGAMTLAAWIGPKVSSALSSGLFPPPYIITTDDTFDSVNATTGMSAGQVDVFVTYIPLPKSALDTNVCHVYTTT